MMVYSCSKPNQKSGSSSKVPRMFEACDRGGTATANGFTLDDCIQAAIDLRATAVGFTAPDAECFVAFRQLVVATVRAWNAHALPSGSPVSDGSKRQRINATFFDGVTGLDALARHTATAGRLVSLRVRANRNLRGMPLVAGLTRSDSR